MTRNDPQLSAVFNRLDELGEGMYSLGIEACRYKDHWPDTFGEVLREERLFALNALAAAFPPMEDYGKFCAVVEYADANTSKAYIALAVHLDEFEFFSGIRDEDDLSGQLIPFAFNLNIKTFFFDVANSQHKKLLFGKCIRTQDAVASFKIMLFLSNLISFPLYMESNIKAFIF